nr:MAG: hypothetical protein [Ilomantsi sobemovirus]
MSSCDFKYSTGMVVPLTDLMGRLKYQATTAPGFSGSPYMSGNMCVGMHVHGGAFNGGYSVVYLHARLKHVIKTQTDYVLASDLNPEKKRYSTQQQDGKSDEGSDSMAEDEEIFEFEEVGHSRTGHRMAVARAGHGRYIYARAETFERLKDAQRRAQPYRNIGGVPFYDWNAAVDAEELEDNIRDNLYEAECLVGPNGARFSGEGQPPAGRDAPGLETSKSRPASQSLKDAKQQLSTKRARSIQQLGSVSTEQLSRFLAWHGSGNRLKPVTAQPTPAPRQSGPRS